MSSARFTTIFPTVLTGINVRNRFVYVSNIWDKKALTFPYHLED